MGTQPPTGAQRQAWIQLGAGILGMIAVANFQYAWTLFVAPLHQAHGWSIDQIQDGLYIYFILAQTWLVPLQGYLAERFGARQLVIAGGLLAGLAWVIHANTTTLEVLYAAQVLAGCGSGIVYSVSVGNALKWFSHRRGLAAGLTAAAFGAGSAATILPILWTIEASGYQTAFLWFGLGQGLVVILAGSLMHFPEEQSVTVQAPVKVLQSHVEYTTRQMLMQPTFWLLYAMMTIGAVPGLLMLGWIKPMAEAFGIADVRLSLLGIDLGAALPIALILDPLSGGLTRPVFGWLSDHVGRERAIFLAFALEGLALLALIIGRHNAAVFVTMSALAFFGWGALFGLFPAVSADMFGRQCATTNYAFLYTAKGAGSLLVAVCNRWHEATGNWPAVFALMIAADWTAALLALFVLKPLRERQARQAQTASTTRRPGH
jgi:OFA family oxalate/formate antiporter-like MFS transporter